MVYIARSESWVLDRDRYWNGRRRKVGRIVVQRVGGFSSEDIHRALFPSKTPEPKSLDQLKEGIRDRLHKRYARPIATNVLVRLIARDEARHPGHSAAPAMASINPNYRSAREQRSASAENRRAE